LQSLEAMDLWTIACSFYWMCSDLEARICVCACVCACVCLRERERGRALVT